MKLNFTQIKCSHFIRLDVRIRLPNFTEIIADGLSLNGWWVHFKRLGSYLKYDFVQIICYSSGDEFEEKIEVRSAKKAKTTNEKKPKIEPKKRSTKKKVETDSEEEFKANLSDDDEEEFHSAVEGSDSGDDFVQDDDTKRKKKLSKTKPKTTERIKVKLYNQS